MLGAVPPTPTINQTFIGASTAVVGVKEFECEYCTKKFFNSFSLKRHVLTHQKKKAFNCEHCTLQFSRMDTLIAHLSTHSESGAVKRPQVHHSLFILYCFVVLSDMYRS